MEQAPAIECAASAELGGHREKHRAGQAEQLRHLGAEHGQVLVPDLHRRPGTPARNWTYTNCQGTGGGQVIASSFAHVPTPRNLIASRGTDKATAIYQPSTDTYWDFWRAEKDASGHWSACWGGKIANYSSNPGIFAHPLGATATGLPLGAFVIRISELERGKIDHAINLITVRTRARCFSWPASRDDGNTKGT